MIFYFYFYLTIFQPVLLEVLWPNLEKLSSPDFGPLRALLALLYMEGGGDCRG